MANQEWSNLGDDIKNLVQSAIDSKDFQKLNETIGKTIHTAMEGIDQGLNQAGDQINRAAETLNQKAARQRENPGQYSYKKSPAQNPWKRKEEYRVTRAPEARLFKGTGGLTGGGMTLAVTGCTVMAGLGIAILVLGMVGLATGMVGIGARIALGILVPLFLGSGCIGLAGTKMVGRARRFKTYVSKLQSHKYCSIKELAAAIGKSEKYVLKDVKDMIRRRMFIEGSLDQRQTCLIASHEVYEQYQMMQAQLAEKRKQEQRIEVQQREKNDSLPEAARKIIQEGNQYIQQIRACNYEIKGEEMSEKISRMEIIIQKIFARVECQPELVSDLHKFMSYYLPTTVKLLHAYQELDAQTVQGANIISSKEEIEGTLDTINEAFENLLDSFFQDTAWDISSDISVLQTMLAQEGLTGSDFEAKK